MPEAPEIRKYTDLFQRFVGRRVKMNRKDEGTVKRIYRHGKVMYIETNSCVLKCGLCLRGSWKPAAESATKPDHVMYTLDFSGEIIYLVDPMTLARITTLPSTFALDDDGTSSVDVYDMTWDDFVEAYSGRKSKLYYMLSNQKLIAGVGSYLRCEILYDAKILPTRTMSDLSGREKRRLFESMKKICRDAYENPNYTLKIYGRKGVSTIKTGKTSVYYDPDVQK
jgi:formamidopyrimidine-DNA glycosylase